MQGADAVIFWAEISIYPPFGILQKSRALRPALNMNMNMDAPFIRSDISYTNAVRPVLEILIIAYGGRGPRGSPRLAAGFPRSSEGPP